MVIREGLVVAYEIGQRALFRGAEGQLAARERGLEEHRPVVVPVGAVYDRLRQFLGRCQALVLVGLGDADQGVPPSRLGSQYFFRRDLRAQLPWLQELRTSPSL